MAKVDLGTEIKLNIVGAFDTLDEAERLANEVFTCGIVAIGRTQPGDGKAGIPYLRPSSSKDVTIWAYAVVALQLDDYPASSDQE